MGKIILEDVKPDEVSQKLQDAGVRPEERVRIVAWTRPDGLDQSVDALRREVEASGFTEEDFAEIVGMKPDEFETLYGRPMRPRP